MHEIFEYKLLSNKIVFVDGLARTGKAVLNILLLSFENFSSIQFINVLEQLLPMYVHKKITKNAISALLRLYLNENFYNYKLSRNINFRYDDLTSVHKTKDIKKFYKNLGKKDGDKIIEELLQENITFQFQTHDLLTHYEKFLQLEIDAHLIELFRNPIDTVHSWYLRGWGRRFDNSDPRNATTLFKYKEQTLPHYVVDHIEEYICLNEMEKCVFMHNILLKKSIQEYKKLDKKKKDKILLLKYEDLLRDPDMQLKKIINFLNAKPTSHIVKAKLEAGVPRNIDENNRKIKMENIKSNINVKLMKELNNLEESYYKFHNLKD